MKPPIQQRFRVRNYRTAVIYAVVAGASMFLLLYQGLLGRPHSEGGLGGRSMLEVSLEGFDTSGSGLQQQGQQQRGGSGGRWHRAGAARSGSNGGGGVEGSADWEDEGVVQNPASGFAAAGQEGGDAAAGGLRSGGRERRPPLSPLPASVASLSTRQIWLYSLIPADYDGETVLPHWIKHYQGLGIKQSNFIVLINHNPEKYSDDGVKQVAKVLESYGVQYRVWRGQYSSEQHLKQKLILFNEVIKNLEDWILIADSDEFQDYGGMPIPLFLAHADMQGATYIKGDMIDRLAPDGAMPAMEPTPSIYEQFPLQCHVVANLYGGKTKKIAAFKAFLRSNQGNHKIVPPEHAMEYFAGSEPGEASLRGGFYGSEDLFPLTPYYQYHDRYIYRGQPYALGSSWDDYPYSLTVTVLHFKWHAAVLRNMQDRVKFYKGSADEGGLPRYKHYHEAEKVVLALNANNHLNLTGLHCSSTLNLQRRQHQRQELRGPAMGAEPGLLPPLGTQLPAAEAAGAAAATTAQEAGPGPRFPEQPAQ